MFRPPPNYRWRQQVNAYESNFRRKVPQWVLALDMDSATKLLGVVNRLRLKLHPEVLPKGEARTGPASPWGEFRNIWDAPARPAAKPNFES